MRSLGIFLLALLVGTSTWARTNEKDMGLDDIMDAYLMAKADVGNIELEPKNVEKEPYTVQVAAYLSEQDAVRHVKQLKSSQKDVFYFTSFARGQVWYKVCVGRFADIKRSERFRKNFVKKMEEPFAVVIALKGKVADRETASLKKEDTPLPIEKAKAPKNSPKKNMKVAMLKKDQAKNKVPVTLGTTSAKDYLYSLQVGAFATEKEAQEKAEALKLDEKTIVKSAVVNGKTWYRVLVGSFNTKSAAEIFRASYKQQTQDSAAFVKRLSK